MNNYDAEVKQRWGGTEAYQEYEQKAAGANRQEVNDGLMAVLAKFAECKQSGQAAHSAEAQALVKALQGYITRNYYSCTNQILAGLGKMYVADERFKSNIDKNGTGTAEFISAAIEFYCKQQMEATL